MLTSGLGAKHLLIRFATLAGQFGLKHNFKSHWNLKLMIQNTSIINSFHEYLLVKEFLA